MKKRRLIIAAILAAILALTAVSVPLIRKNKAVRIAKSLPPYILEAVLAYNDLISPGELTLEMFEEVTSLRFMYDKAVIVSVNGSKFGTNLGPYVLPNRMERLYLAQIPEGTHHRVQFGAFFMYLSSDMPAMSEYQEDMLTNFCTEAWERPLYVFDVLASGREKNHIMGYLFTYVFTSGEIMTERVLDLSSLSVFPNLSYVEYFIDTDIVHEWEYPGQYELTFENCPVEIRVTEGTLFDRRVIEEHLNKISYE